MVDGGDRGCPSENLWLYVNCGSKTGWRMRVKEFICKSGYFEINVAFDRKPMKSVKSGS
jgi:hypothetical protein